MDSIRIIGGRPLHGTVRITGAKNAALPLMCACLLSDEPLMLTNMPHLADIATMANLLAEMGVTLHMEGHRFEGANLGRVITLEAGNLRSTTAPYEIVRKMRASVLVLGPLLARHGKAKVSLPGGCAIGTRPVDMHLKALEELGAEIELDQGYVNARVNGRLRGAEITFDKVSVGATENLLMAASLAEGRTVIHNAAREPEISDLAYCLNAMGAQITGIGSDELTIEGVDRLHAATHQVMPDRIEAGTYAAAAAITGGKLTLKSYPAEHGLAWLEKLQETGSLVEPHDDGLTIHNPDGIHPADITTQPYPGFPTDMQAQFMALLTLANGASAITETIFENRFMHVSELARMGANIVTHGNTALVRGVSELRGAPVMATDLRASVSLALAALAAKGETVINRIYHLDRGYERLEETLRQCGADIERIRD